MKGVGKHGWRGMPWRSICGSFIKDRLKGRKPLQKLFFPLSFEGEGDKGGEVENNLISNIWQRK